MMSDQGSKEKWKRGNQFQGEDQDDQQHQRSQQGGGDRNFQDGYAGHDSQDGHGGGGEGVFQDKNGRYERLDTRMCKDTPVEKDDINCRRATEKMWCESNNVSNPSEINKRAREMQKREDDSERIESSSLIEQSGEEEGREVEDCKKGKRRICNNKESSQKIVTSMKWLRGVISICGNNKTNKSKCKKIS